MEQEVTVFVDLGGVPHRVGLPTASLSLAMEVAAYFDLSVPDARRIVWEVGVAVSGWRRQAARLGIAPSEIEQMASAFEHGDLQQSLAMGGRA